jgi:flavorubredoxin
VLDTIDARKTNEWMDNLTQALDGRRPDYLVVSHMEPDHSSNVKLVLDTWPDITVVCTQKAVQLITRFFGVELPQERVMLVKDGDTLPLGEHTLRFFTAPMVSG